ncbi:caa(3)-type oxidase subunit IV [Methylorubrum populi]|uniref:Caa(3)-type oxidase subunit IV n=1 Tax=Methylorubrum populi TaxID=223967 RepID=A0A169QB25_9HYPH|nr:cytochrome C oxidase subunit IV family protein [Methylorubrum populi]BAU88633.1 caa(3)-type oxidase subunit IV [Methylorubrum populi]
MSEHERPSTGGIWLRGLVVWALLLALLGLSVVTAYAAPASWAGALNFGIAATQAGLVALLFMRLDRADTLGRELITAARLSGCVVGPSGLEDHEWRGLT